jgi:phi LC3 family holin
MFDWKIRVRNKAFILSLASAVMLFAQVLLKPYRIVVNESYIMSVVNAGLGVLMILGIVSDPTSPGVTDKLKKVMYGKKYRLRKDKVDGRDCKFTALHMTATAKSVDLRGKMPHVYDQGDLGSCTANAGVAYMEFLKPGTKLSRLFMYYKERILEGTVNKDSGASIRDECKVAANGVCLESLMPYDIERFNVVPSDNAESDALTHKIRQYQSLKSLTQIKQALTLGKPVTIGMDVYGSFESSIVAKTGKMIMPKRNEQNLGGHAVLVVGFKDSTCCIGSKGYLICRNSWGSDWGDAGYFYMPYEYVSRYTFDYWIMEG